MELTNITYDIIQKFCEQKIPEGQKIEYKTSFPKGIKLERSICALGNTLGGIIFVGVKADKKTNIPETIPGIELEEGLEEKIINKCLSWINPPLIPEIRVCAFDSNNKAVIFIRVPKSIQAPHEIMRENEIFVRTHNRINKANLNTIEQLLERRNQQLRGGVSQLTSCTYQHVDTNENEFQSVMLVPKLGLQSDLIFTKTLDNALKEASRVVNDWNDIKVSVYKVELFNRSIKGRIRAYAQIFPDGRVTYQEPTYLNEKALDFSHPMLFLKRCIEAAKKVYPIFGYHGELGVGLTICGVLNVKIISPKYRFFRGDFTSESNVIHIPRTIDLRELEKLPELFRSIINDYCRSFGLSLESNKITRLISEFYSME